MRQAARTARYDQALGLEAYSLRAVDRPFPSHFHDHYVIGVVERGTRTLTCGRQRQVIGPGDVLLFNPGDSHACIQADGALDYRGLNIPRSTMLALAEEIMGSRQCPAFPWPWFGTENWQGRLRALHRAVLGGGAGAPEGGGAAAGLGPPAAGLRRDGGNGFCLPGGGGADLCVHPEPLCPAYHAGGAQPSGGTEQIRPGPGLCQGQGCHALPLSDGGADQRGTAPAGTGCLLCRGRRGDRLFRSEPFHQLFHCLHRA